MILRLLLSLAASVLLAFPASAQNVKLRSEEHTSELQSH